MSSRQWEHIKPILTINTNLGSTFAWMICVIKLVSTLEIICVIKLMYQTLLLLSGESMAWNNGISDHTWRSWKHANTVHDTPLQTYLKHFTDSIQLTFNCFVPGNSMLSTLEVAHFTQTLLVHAGLSFLLLDITNSMQIWHAQEHDFQTQTVTFHWNGNVKMHFAISG